MNDSQLAAAESVQCGSRLRWSIYTLLIIVSLATICGRLAAVRSSLGKTAMLSANDRSRWATVRSLVEQGQYALDDVIFLGPQRARSGEWYTIDLVRHRGPDGREHYYSSKPPLLATLIAAPYWLLNKVTGWNMKFHSLLVMRCLLVFVNVLPLACYLWLVARWAERYGRTDWGRIFVVATAAFGTLLTTFAVTLNNHLPAAICTAVTAWLGLRILHDKKLSWWYFALAGLFAALAVTSELPALSFTVLLTALLLYCYPQRTLLFYVPALTLVAAAFFGTNYLAHGTWRPAYSSRSDGPLLATVALPPPEQQLQQPVSAAARQSLKQAGIELSDQALLSPRPSGRGWQLWDPASHMRYALHWRDDSLEIRQWGNWYEYERSYWLPGQRAGVDRGEPYRSTYALHVLVGHHGIFSLTPVWLLSVLGLGILLRRSDRTLRLAAAAIVLISVVCVVFYLSRPLIDRNYGGVSSGFRWMFWLAPLWLWAMLPAADWLAARRPARGLALLLLAVSVFSASYPALNPWSHPWLFRLLSYWEWIRY